jgi:hypothetical protein
MRRLKILTWATRADYLRSLAHTSHELIVVSPEEGRSDHGDFPPNLRAIVKLRYSAGCDEKRALLVNIKKESDERALFELVPLQDHTGCGARKKDDCYPCLRSSNELDDTIAAVRGRKR